VGYGRLFELGQLGRGSRLERRGKTEDGRRKRDGGRQSGVMCQYPNVESSEQETEQRNNGTTALQGDGATG
jgi:hypothetical protein